MKQQGAVSGDKPEGAPAGEPAGEPVTEPLAEPATPAAAGKEVQGAPFVLQEIVVAGKSTVILEDYTLPSPIKPT